jgi:hypothetical protein
VGAAVIFTLIFASPGASAFSSGSRTDSTGPTGARSNPSADYWHALAVKRLHLLGKRERRIVALLKELRRAQAHRGSGQGGSLNSRQQASDPRSVICSVFGAHCSEAIHVARCESTLNVYARNGDYEGLFQFGSFARAHYGFAWDALTQARAAYRYFLDAGWSPWQCRP